MTDIRSGPVSRTLPRPVSSADLSPSAAQIETYTQRPVGRPVVLFYEFSHRNDDKGVQVVAQLAELARAHRGRMRWRGLEEHVMIGALPRHRHCARLHFPTRAAALELVRSPAHAALFAGAEALQLAVLNEQPRAAGLVIGLLARLLPLWPFFDNTEDPAPEPGIGTSIMPTHAAYDAFIAHADATRPIVMVNWLRFRKQAQYAPGHGDDGAPVSGKAAYYRYGKVAMTAIHSLGGRVLFTGRYQQILIGNNGEPGVARWHEFAMVEYPGRARFQRMTALRRYRAALHHRAAGLDDGGQGLIVTRPLD